MVLVVKEFVERLTYVAKAIYDTVVLQDAVRYVLYSRERMTDRDSLNICINPWHYYNQH